MSTSKTTTMNTNEQTIRRYYATAKFHEKAARLLEIHDPSNTEHINGHYNDAVKCRVAAAKREIQNALNEKHASGEETTIESFSDLHDYFDANWFGGIMESDYEISKDYERENEIQRQLDEWIKKGMPLSSIKPATT